MNSESIKNFLLDLAAKFKPIQINPTLKIENLNQTISIAGKTYKVKDGILIVGDKPSDMIPLIKDNKGFIRPEIEGTQIEGIADSKKENLKMLDVEEKVFTRADIGELQLGLLHIEKEHERIIKKLKPILNLHLNGIDLGALLSAATMIKAEDKKEDYEMCKKLKTQFNASYQSRGAMIYNLFRSNILEIEVLGYLKNLRKIYKKPEIVKAHFLIYWDSILEKGYPTAYFIKEEDNLETLHKEIKWRLDQGIQRIYVYSRIATRNKNTEIWSRKIAKDEGCRCKKIKEYNLGFTPAAKFRITKK